MVSRVLERGTIRLVSFGRSRSRNSSRFGGLGPNQVRMTGSRTIIWFALLRARFFMTRVGPVSEKYTSPSASTEYAYSDVKNKDRMTYVHNKYILLGIEMRSGQLDIPKIEWIVMSKSDADPVSIFAITPKIKAVIRNGQIAFQCLNV